MTPARKIGKFTDPALDQQIAELVRAINEIIAAVQALTPP